MQKEYPSPTKLSPLRRKDGRRGTYFMKKRQKGGRNALATQVVTVNDLKYMNITDEEIIQSLMIPPRCRSTDDLTIIQYFLDCTELANKFRADNLNRTSLEKILLLCATEVGHLFLHKNSTLFHIGDQGDKFFIIVKGKVSILKPVSEIASMTGFEFFRYIVELREANETYLLKLILDGNRDIAQIAPEDFNMLNYIILTICIENFFNRNNYLGIYVSKLEELFELCHVDIAEFKIDINNDKNQDPVYCSKIMDSIFGQMPKFKRVLKTKYANLASNTNKTKIVLYKYHQFLTLSNGDFFGDSALDKDTTRNATIRTLEDTDFCFLDNKNYNSYLKAEKKMLTMKEVSFLTDNFIFRSIPPKYFENRILNSFIYEEKVKGEAILREGENCNFVYFIREGEVELTMFNSLMEMYNILDYLAKIKITNPQYVINENLSSKFFLGFQNDLTSMSDEILKKRKIKLLDIETKQMFGAENVFFGLNFLYSVVVKSQKVKYYKIGVKQLLKIIKEEADCYSSLHMVSEKKISVLFNRLSNLYKFHMDLVDREFTTKKKVKEEEDKKNLKEESLNLSDKVTVKAKIKISKNLKLALPQTPQFLTQRDNYHKFLPSLGNDRQSAIEELKKRLTSPSPIPLLAQTISTDKEGQGIKRVSTCSLSAEKKLVEKITKEIKRDKLHWMNEYETFRVPNDRYSDSQKTTETFLTEPHNMKSRKLEYESYYKRNKKYLNASTGMDKSTDRGMKITHSGISNYNTKSSNFGNTTATTLVVPDLSQASQNSVSKSFRSSKIKREKFMLKAKQYTEFKRKIMEKIQKMQQ